MRGANSLYNDLLDNPLESIPPRKSFTDERDRAMVHRYYYHAHLIRRNYEDCIYHLHLEFFLSDGVIIQRLTAHLELIHQLKTQSTDSKHLARIYPHFNWNL